MNLGQYIDLDKILPAVLEWLATSGLRILLILIILFLAVRIAGAISRRLFDFIGGRGDPEARKRADTLEAVVRYCLIVTLGGVAFVMILGEFGVEIGPVLAAAGVVGLAVGFGAQSLVKDVISGFMILLDDQIRVGDVVVLDGTGGLCEKVNLRYIQLRDLGGNVHFIRCGDISKITNMTKEFSFALFDIGVAYRENVDDVITVIKEVAGTMQNDDPWKADILEPMEMLGVDKFGDSSVVIKARIKTKPIRQWSVMREYNRRLKLRFDELDIEIPFPHMTLYAGVDKDGTAPPIRIVSGNGGRDQSEAPGGGEPKTES